MGHRTDYEKETGEKALYRMPGTSSDYHTLKYVTWLESLLSESQQRVRELEKLVKEQNLWIVYQSHSKKCSMHSGEVLRHCDCNRNDLVVKAAKILEPAKGDDT